MNVNKNLPSAGATALRRDDVQKKKAVLDDLTVSIARGPPVVGKHYPTSAYSNLMASRAVFPIFLSSLLPLLILSIAYWVTNGIKTEINYRDFEIVEHISITNDRKWKAMAVQWEDVQRKTNLTPNIYQLLDRSLPRSQPASYIEVRAVVCTDEQHHVETPSMSDLLFPHLSSSNMLSEQKLSVLKSVEERARGLANFDALCFTNNLKSWGEGSSYDSNGRNSPPCVPISSLSTYFFPGSRLPSPSEHWEFEDSGEGSAYNLPYNRVIKRIMMNKDALWYVDPGFTREKPLATAARFQILLARPFDPQTPMEMEEYLTYAHYLARQLLPLIEEINNNRANGIVLSAGGPLIEHALLEESINQESKFLIAAAIIVWVVMWFRTHQLLLSLCVAAQVVFVTTSSFCLFALGNDKRVPLLSYTTLFFTCGLSVHLFSAVIDSFRSSGIMASSGRRNTLSLSQRVAYTLRHACASNSLTIVIAAILFATCQATQFRGVVDFSSLVLIQLAETLFLTWTFMPAAVIVSHRLLSRNDRLIQRQRDILERVAESVNRLQRRHPALVGFLREIEEVNSVEGCAVLYSRDLAELAMVQKSRRKNIARSHTTVGVIKSLKDGVAGAFSGMPSLTMQTENRRGPLPNEFNESAFATNDVSTYLNPRMAQTVFRIPSDALCAEQMTQAVPDAATLWSWGSKKTDASPPVSNISNNNNNNYSSNSYTRTLAKTDSVGVSTSDTVASKGGNCPQSSAALSEVRLASRGGLADADEHVEVVELGSFEYTNNSINKRTIDDEHERPLRAVSLDHDSAASLRVQDEAVVERQVVGTFTSLAEEANAEGTTSRQALRGVFRDGVAVSDLSEEASHFSPRESGENVVVASGAASTQGQTSAEHKMGQAQRTQIEVQPKESKDAYLLPLLAAYLRAYQQARHIVIRPETVHPEGNVASSTFAVSLGQGVPSIGKGQREDRLSHEQVFARGGREKGWLNKMENRWSKRAELPRRLILFGKRIGETRAEKDARVLAKVADTDRISWVENKVAHLYVPFLNKGRWFFVGFTIALVVAFSVVASRATFGQSRVRLATSGVLGRFDDAGRYFINTEERCDTCSSYYRPLREFNTTTNAIWNRCGPMSPTTLNYRATVSNSNATVPNPYVYDNMCGECFGPEECYTRVPPNSSSQTCEGFWGGSDCTVCSGPAGSVCAPDGSSIVACDGFVYTFADRDRAPRVDDCGLCTRGTPTSCRHRWVESPEEDRLYATVVLYADRRAEFPVWYIGAMCRSVSKLAPVRGECPPIDSIGLTLSEYVKSYGVINDIAFDEKGYFHFFRMQVWIPGVTKHSTPREVHDTIDKLNKDIFEMPVLNFLMPLVTSNAWVQSATALEAERNIKFVTFLALTVGFACLVAITLSLRLALIAIVCIGGCSACTLGVIVAAGWELNALIMCCFPGLFAIPLCHISHMALHYMDRLEEDQLQLFARELTTKEAVRTMMSRTLMTVVGACAASGVVCIPTAFSKVHAMYVVAIVMLISHLWSLLFACVLFPACLCAVGPVTATPHQLLSILVLLLCLVPIVGVTLSSSMVNPSGGLLIF